MPSNSELAVQQYAYVKLSYEEAETGILAAIEADLQAGLSPDQIATVWRQVSSFENMPQMVRLAARYLKRQGGG